jgi:hypothetical protein
MDVKAARPATHFDGAQAALSPVEGPKAEGRSDYLTPVSAIRK